MKKYVITEELINSLQEGVRKDFRHWREFMYKRLRFNIAKSKIHAHAHCERVLLHSLILGHALMPDDSRGRLALALASVFHDTRRLNDYLDTGHGARAAVYYKNFCAKNPDVPYLPEAAYAMRYHDLNDRLGIETIRHDLGENAPRGLKVYKLFKDSDALDRWRLGHNGLDVRFLRSDMARQMVGFAKDLVTKTMDADFLAYIERKVDEALEQQKAEHKVEKHV